MVKFTSDTKKALFMNGIRVTEYEWDDIVELEKYILLIQEHGYTMNIKVFDKEMKEITATFNNVRRYKVKWNKLIIITKTDSESVYKLSGEVVFDNIKKFIISSKEHIISITDASDKVYLYNASKDEMLPQGFDAAMFKNNGIMVAIGDKKGFYSYDFKLVIPIEYLALYFNNGYLRVQKQLPNGKALYGLCTKEGNTILPIEFEEIILNKEEVIIRKDTKYGLYDYEGKVLLPPIYDEINWCYDKKLVQCKYCDETKYYIVDLGKFFTKKSIKIERDGYSYCLDGTWYHHN